MGLGDLDRTLKADYETMVSDQLVRGGELVRQLEAERRARRAAMTPEERELEDLRNRVGILEQRLEHARAALAGEDCGYGS